jgi:hypothetical protein
MVKKPNYGQERAQRSRVQQDRKREKLQRREEESLKRKASRDGQPNSNPEPNER